MARQQRLNALAAILGEAVAASGLKKTVIATRAVRTRWEPHLTDAMLNAYLKAENGPNEVEVLWALEEVLSEAAGVDYHGKFTAPLGYASAPVMPGAAKKKVRQLKEQTAAAEGRARPRHQRTSRSESG